MKFAVLIPTLPERKELLQRVINVLLAQMNDLDLLGGVNEKDAPECEMDVSILIYSDNREKTTGEKRNELVEWAIEFGAKGIAFIDDDDLVGPTYIKRAMEFVDSGMDCAELFGQYYENGKKLNPFHHSLKYDHWFQDAKMYYRNPNHLSFLRLDKVKDIKYPHITIGEDGQYSIALQKAGVLKTEYPIPEIIYYYYAGNPKHELV